MPLHLSGSDTSVDGGLSRRRFLAGAAVVGLSAEMGVAPDPAAAAPDASRPNVVLVVADDMGRSCLRSYGGVEHDMTRLAAFAGQGMQFNYFHCRAMCTSSRQVLLTSKHLHEAEDDEKPMLAHVMQQAGYTTGIARK